MARKQSGSKGWQTCLVLFLAALVVVALFVVFAQYFREPVSRAVADLMAMPTAAAPPQASATTRPPSGAATATPRPTLAPATPTPRVGDAPTRPAPTPRGPTPTLAAQGATVDNLVLFVEPEAGRQPIQIALDNAQKSIDMVMYLLLDQAIVDRLIAAKKRGIAVRVLLEPNPFGGGDGRPLAEQLRQAGVQVKDSNPMFRFTHQKTIIVDNRLALIMTLNQTNAAFTRNRGYGIADLDPIRVAEIQAVFDADWNRTRARVQQPDLVWSPNNSREKLIALLQSARRSLDIQTEVMSDNEVIETLIAKVRQGIKVRVIMSPPEADSTTEAGLARLSRAGVEVRLVRTPYIHAKLVIVDGVRGWIGSVNFSSNSLDNNRELGILLRDAPIIRTLSATFERDWGRVN